MTTLTPEQKEALEIARYLAENGCPVFVAKRDRSSSCGFRLPNGWQRTTPDPTVVDRWKPGMALALVTGALVDVVDVDPRNGGDLSALEGVMPTVYGQADTPSGGTHSLIAALGVPKDVPSPGIDLQSGDANGNGRGFVFLAPTVRESKVDGRMKPYVWTTEPDVDVLALVGGDETGAALAALVRERQKGTYEGPEYDGLGYDDLTSDQQARARLYVDELVQSWTKRLTDALEWSEGERDEHGRGWEGLVTALAWSLALVAVSPWSPLDPDEAHDLYLNTLPHEMAVDDNVAADDKWDASLIAKAAAEPVEPPPWQTPFDVYVDDDQDNDTQEGERRRPVDVTNEADALAWLKSEVGQRRLAGVFRRGHELVHTPRIGEEGYLPPRNDRDNSGPAQVRRIDPLGLASRIDHGYVVTKKSGKATQPVMFPQAVASRAAAAPDLLANIRDLTAVTHTPVVRKDGTILDRPGYDDASGVLYLPDPGLSVPPVSAAPSAKEVRRAGRMLLEIVADFPFVTPHDRANYLGALLTPLLRPLVPPPYKLVAIGAPQRGSGKSLLASVMRVLHGGVFKSEMPTSDDELRKFVTSTLEQTTGPVVQFDNVMGVLKSSVLDGLLTSAEWSDRRLGATEMVTIPNDRLWVATGNNVHIGGDLERRTLWVTLNAGVERPEERTGFAIGDLEDYVRRNRGDLLWALLTVVRAWVVAGSQEPPHPTSDSFGRWVAVLRGILANAELGETVGVVGHVDSVQQASDPDAEEWARFLAAVHQEFGTEPWKVNQLLDRSTIDDDDLPGDIAEKLERSVAGATKSLGKWLSNRQNRWAGGLCVQATSDKPTRKTRQWRIAEIAETEAGRL